ncbi:protein TIFY 4B-like isoform X2 [Curcuma longa]|uniref:protein TIFY 4B-like isoform X2 n=1 Tax=Curcuma longa TaxID=136217 RepID=UPI003D9DE761
MSAADNATQRELLEKPLAELTEEDIAQLTREDCRRFLKANGMRRPSWNKSQVIQQAISLKALREGRPGCDDCPAGGEIRRKCVPACSQQPRASPEDSFMPREARRLLSPPKELSPYRRRDPIPLLQYSAGSPTSRIPIAMGDHADTLPENRLLSARTTAELPVATQMSIFYDGMANAYDGVTCDRRPSAAQTKIVLDLAASTTCFDDVPRPVPAQPPGYSRLLGFPTPSVAPRLSGPLSFLTANGRAGHHAADGGEDGRTPRETEPADGGTTRKASLQRYLEKRKDRFKGKKVLGGPIYSCSEKMYFNENFRCPNPIDFIDLNMTSLSPITQHQAPHSPASCPENQGRTDRFLIDLNVDGDENC